jgi:hypothetical protein
MEGAINLLLIMNGLGAVAAGDCYWPLSLAWGLGHSSQRDIAIRGDMAGSTFTVVTCLLVSLVLTLIFWLAGKL